MAESSDSSRASTGLLIVLVVGCLLIAGALVTATLAVIAERELGDERQAVADREADATAVRDEQSGVRDVDAQIQTLVASQGELRSDVAGSWNALVEQADEATKAITRSIQASNDGDTDSATAILDTEVGAAVEASQDHQGSLREAAVALETAVDELRDSIEATEQR